MTDNGFRELLDQVQATAALRACARESIEIGHGPNEVVLSVHGGKLAGLSPIETRALAKRLNEEADRADKAEASRIRDERLWRIGQGELPTFCPACGLDAFFINRLSCFIHADKGADNEACWKKADERLIHGMARDAALERAYGRDAAFEIPGADHA